MGLSKKGIIVDAVAFNKFIDVNHIDSQPVHKYIEEQKLKLVYGDDKKSLAEIKKNRCMSKIVANFKKRGVAFQVNSKEKKNEIDNDNNTVNGEKLKSNDTHIIAVALMEKKARLLFSVSKGDKKLHTDFKSPKIIKNPRGNIYTKREHSHLL